MPTKKEYDAHLAEVQKNVDTFPFKVFGPVIETCLNKFNIPYSKVFSQIDILCAYKLKYNNTEFYCIVDAERMKIVFEINRGSPYVDLDIFSYGEIFEPEEFHRKYLMMTRIVHFEIYYK